MIKKHVKNAANLLHNFFVNFNCYEGNLFNFELKVAIIIAHMHAHVNKRRQGREYYFQTHVESTQFTICISISRCNQNYFISYVLYVKLIIKKLIVYYFV